MDVWVLRFVGVEGAGPLWACWGAPRPPRAGLLRALTLGAGVGVAPLSVLNSLRKTDLHLESTMALNSKRIKQKLMVYS